jgi:hypothetical protein
MLKLKGNSRPPKASSRRLFHGVALNPGAECCDAMRAIGEQRFLSDDAPRLPLDDCTLARTCRCVYRHFDDRRTQARRDTDIGAPPRDYPDNRRVGAGRRVTDD